MALFNNFVEIYSDQAKSRTKTYKERKMGITPIIMIKIIITRQKIESSVYIRSLFETVQLNYNNRYYNNLRQFDRYDDSGNVLQCCSSDLNVDFTFRSFLSTHFAGTFLEISILPKVSICFQGLLPPVSG